MLEMRCMGTLFLVLLVASSAQLTLAQEAEETPPPEHVDVPRFLRQLDSEVISERVAAADALGSGGGYERRDDIIEALIARLEAERDWTVQASIVRALGRLEARPALPMLVRMLRSDRVEVRMTAAAALWRVPAVAVTPALVERLDDREASVRQWSATALGTIRDPRAVEPLMKSLDDEATSVRLEAIRSLRQIRAPASVEELKSHAMSPDFGFDEQREALAAVLEIVDDDARALLDMMETPVPRVRQHLARGLGALGDESILSEMQRLLRRERNWNVRRELRRAIQLIRRREPTQPDR